ncbi:MAG: hypothetical protein HY269_06490, partial [Deltaproteobacteria bacterium]|nr:hypothetical protein [Deltaproteobacteria bacterium]
MDRYHDVSRTRMRRTPFVSLARPTDPMFLRGRTKTMTRLLAVTIVLFLALTGATMSHDEKKKKLPDPTPRKEAILKLFVSEFVDITPGKGKFPESF